MSGDINLKKNFISMKKILYITAALLIFIGFNACQSPEEFTPSIERNGINSITASFINDDLDENKFISEIDYTNRVINIIFPYNYPRLSDNVLDISKLAKVKVSADLDNNVKIVPSLLFMDLTQENIISVVTLNSGTIDYIVKAEIRKSNECSITDFKIPSIGLTGIINESNKTISLVSLEPIGETTAEVKISHGATISPDPATIALNYDNEQEITVTAQNGVDTKKYIVKRDIPKKIERGIRKGSEKLLWVKKLTDLGLTQNNMVRGIAATREYVVINESGQNAVYVDAKTGVKAGMIDLSSIYGTVGSHLKNFYATADDDGNILINNLGSTDAGLPMTIWKLSSVTSKPEVLLTSDVKGIEEGRKISVIGSVTKDAIITTGLSGYAGQFDSWKITNGVVEGRTLIVSNGGIDAGNMNVDIIFKDPKSNSSDYFVACYSAPTYGHIWYNGATRTVKATNPINANWIKNAVDYIEFNNTSYLVANSVNCWTWGTDDNIYMYDLTNENLSSCPIDFSSTGLNINGQYGAKALGNTNGNGTGDVAFVASEDGYYLYIYFMFTNGYVGCVRCDCIDL